MTTQDSWVLVDSGGGVPNTGGCEPSPARGCARGRWTVTNVAVHLQQTPTEQADALPHCCGAE